MQIRTESSYTLKHNLVRLIQAAFKNFDRGLLNRKGSVENFPEEAMLIADLDYLDLTQHAHRYQGGVYAAGSTQTVAYREYSYANATATAAGQFTSTVSQTYTKVVSTSFYNSSFADARANAYAITGDSQARYVGYDSSLYLSIRN
ncbi:MAG: hypothetical protein LH702_03355 [Phormidesmis sp. CAN_BIN44]|nr:hypothetical protein [Phormidesmis sp. CAN_BIN44]